MPFEITQEDAIKMLSQLNQSLYHHEEWYKELIRTLACRLTPDKRDLNEHAHLECRFGQWIYGGKHEAFQSHPGFMAVEQQHKYMHEIARKLLQCLDTKSTIAIEDYDNFANALERMRLEVYALKREIEDLLYNRDPLTGAINRMNLLPSLREYHELSKRLSRSYYIAMMDIDGFKEINDQYGHQVGDKILSDTIRLISQVMRPYDKIFRYGGDEFLICIQDVSPAKAFHLVERIRKEIENKKIEIGSNGTIQIHLSFGLAKLDPTLSIEQSIANADKAAVLAKREGKNKTYIFEEYSTSNP